MKVSITVDIEVDFDIDEGVEVNLEDLKTRTCRGVENFLLYYGLDEALTDCTDWYHNSWNIQVKAKP